MFKKTQENYPSKWYNMRYGKTEKSQIIIPAGTHPWPHELRVADILALAGHTVEFLSTGTQKTADILLDGIKYEIKSPFTNNPKKSFAMLNECSNNLRMLLLTHQELKVCVMMFYASFL